MAWGCDSNPASKPAPPECTVAETGVNGTRVEFSVTEAAGRAAIDSLVVYFGDGTSTPLMDASPNTHRFFVPHDYAAVYGPTRETVTADITTVAAAGHAASVLSCTSTFPIS